MNMEPMVQPRAVVTLTCGLCEEYEPRWEYSYFRDDAREGKHARELLVLHQDQQHGYTA